MLNTIITHVLQVLLLKDCFWRPATFKIRGVRGEHKTSFFQLILIETFDTSVGLPRLSKTVFRSSFYADKKFAGRAGGGSQRFAERSHPATSLAAVASAPAQRAAPRQGAEAEYCNVRQRRRVHARPGRETSDGCKFAEFLCAVFLPRPLNIAYSSMTTGAMPPNF